jgi:hypothetical protein
MTDWPEDVDAYRPHWPMAPTDLLPREWWLWWEQLWADVCALRDCYRLPLRSGWWEDNVQAEGLAALAGWIERYDSGEWDDPPGKPACEVVELSALAKPPATGPVSRRISSPWWWAVTWGQIESSSQPFDGPAPIRRGLRPSWDASGR